MDTTVRTPSIPYEHVRIDSSAFKAISHELYARLRRDSPVCRVRHPFGEDAYLVVRYDDVSALLKDKRLAKNPTNALTPNQLRNRRKPPNAFRPLMRNMLSLDDPDHARLKTLVQAAFTPRRVELLITRTQDVADRLLERIARRRRFDLISEYALPLPVTVISELLGVPERDRARFARWSKTLITNGGRPLNMLWAFSGMLAFVRYLRSLIELKRRNPEDDLLSSLAGIEAEGERLDSDELLAMAVILLTAGHETTTNLIGNGVLALLQHPAELEKLRTNPALIDTAIEELLRFGSPVEMSTERFAREDMEIAGAKIARGSHVVGVIASANRDERQFDDANSLDLGRERNRHLTFGEGGHYCVGAALARMEGRVAIGALIQRLSRFSVDQAMESIRWRRGLVLRGLEALRIRSGGGRDEERSIVH